MSLRSVIRELTGGQTLSDVLPAGFRPIDLKSGVRPALTESFAGVFPVECPVLVNISGLPASGKSCYARAFKVEHPEFLYLSFDAVMESLPQYREAYGRDRVKAFSDWELPARFIGYRVLEKAVRARVPILFEHSNANRLHPALYRAITEEGYAVDIRCIDADAALVLPRLSRRARFFAPQKVFERQNLLKDLLPDLKDAATRFTFLKAWKE